MSEEDEENKTKKKSGININYIIIGAIFIIVLFVFLHLNPNWFNENPFILLFIIICIAIYFLSKTLPKFRRDPVEVFYTVFEKDTFDIGYLFNFQEINFDDVTIYSDDETTYRYIFNNPRMNRDMTIVIEYGIGWENVISVEWDTKTKKKIYGGNYFNPYGGYSRTNNYKPTSSSTSTTNKKNIPPSMLK